MRRKDKVAILGCGPAGLFSAHALANAGRDFTIFSNKRRSEMFGAQYLHEPIPGLPSVTTEIEYQLVGTADEYAAKVYGPEYRPERDGVVSPSLFSGRQQVWDIRAAYYAAWEMYSERIVHMPYIDTMTFRNGKPPAGTGNGHDRGCIYLGEYRSIVSSIPALPFCDTREIHRFQSVEVFAIGDAPERGIFVPFSPPPNTVICNGNTNVGWYRASNVFGHSTVEWPGSLRPPVSGVALVTKPIATTCNCAPPATKFLRVGRYGRWEKSELSHSAYARTLNWAMGGKGEL